MTVIAPTTTTIIVVWSLCFVVGPPAMAEVLSAGSVLEELLSFDLEDFGEELKEAVDSASESIGNAVKSTASHYSTSSGRLTVGPVSLLLGQQWVVEAHGAQLSAPARVEVKDLSLSLLYPSMALHLSLGNLHLEGAFHAQGPAAGSTQGRFNVHLKNVEARGHVGITMREDSLLMSAFDLKYKPSDITVNVTRSTGEVDVYPADALDAGVTELLLSRVSPLLDSEVRRSVGEALVEESIGERLGSDELAAAYLKHVERVEFLAAQALGRVLPAGDLVLPEQRLGDEGSSSPWLLTGPLALRGLRVAADGPVSVAAQQGCGKKQVLLFARLKVPPFQLEADWSGSVRGPHGPQAGGLTGRSGGAALSARLQLSGAPTQLQVARLDTVDLSAPHVALPAEPEPPLPLLLTRSVSALLTRSLAPAALAALVKGCARAPV